MTNQIPSYINRVYCSHYAGLISKNPGFWAAKWGEPVDDGLLRARMCAARYIRRLKPDTVNQDPNAHVDGYDMTKRRYRHG